MSDHRPLRSLRRSLTTAAVLLCTVPLIGASCLSSGDDDSSRDRDDLGDSRIPTNARKVAEGRGALSYRAASNGTVYLYDVNDRQVRFTDKLLEGDTFAIRSGEGRVYVNGESAAKVKLDEENTHRIYFDGRRTTSDDRDTTSNRDESRAVPDDARVVAEARGGNLSFKAADNGTVYLYDATNSKLVKTYTVRRGQRFTVSPLNGIVAVDGKTVATGQNLNSRTSYRLLFAN